MKCQMCGKREAKVRYTEMKDDEVNQLRLCEECAEARGFTKLESEGEFSISDLLAGMAADSLPGEELSGAAVLCPRCGLSYPEFKSSGRLGCAECYDTFAAPLVPLLKRIHGSDQHTGKSPDGGDEPHRTQHEIRALKASLDECVTREDFEEAARIRDEIRKLEKSDES